MSQKFGRVGSNKNSKKQAIKEEQRFGKEIGGVAHPNSGAIDGMKGDGSNEEFTYDHKFTEDKSYILSTTDLNKITREAREQNREPMMGIKFYKGISIGVDSEWVILPLRVAKEKGIINDSE